MGARVSPFLRPSSPSVPIEAVRAASVQLTAWIEESGEIWNQLTEPVEGSNPSEISANFQARVKALSDQLKGGLQDMKVTSTGRWIYLPHPSPPPPFYCVYEEDSSVQFGSGEDYVALGFHIPCADCFETPASGAAGA